MSNGLRQVLTLIMGWGCPPILLVSFVGLFAVPVQAATFTVNSTADIVDSNPGGRRTGSMTLPQVWSP